MDREATLAARPWSWAYSGAVNLGPWRDRLRVLMLTLAAFVLSHDLIYLITYRASYDQVMSQTGHGAQWNATVLVVAALAIGLVITAVVRLRQLSRLGDALGQGSVSLRPETGEWKHLVHQALRSWLIILPAALILFVISENTEHLSAGLPLPGLSVLGSMGYVATFMVFALVSLVGAFLDALYRWRRELLAARIAAARARLARPTVGSARRPLPWVEPRHSSIVLHHIAGRAPPAYARS